MLIEPPKVRALLQAALEDKVHDPHPQDEEADQLEDGHLRIIYTSMYTYIYIYIYISYVFLLSCVLYIISARSILCVSVAMRTVYPFGFIEYTNLQNAHTTVLVHCKFLPCHAS